MVTWRGLLSPPNQQFGSFDPQSLIAKRHACYPNPPSCSRVQSDSCGQRSPLLGKANLSALAHRLVAQAAGLHLVSEVLGACLLGLGLVNVLHKDALVLEHVTLRLHVQLVVAAG